MEAPIGIPVGHQAQDHGQPLGQGAGYASNLQYYETTARQILQYAKSDKIVVEKSTLPIRTAEVMTRIFSASDKGIRFEVLSNPEFLAEGTAIQDLLEPDHILIGAHNHPQGEKAARAIVDIYAHWVPEEKIITTNLWSSELSKDPSVAKKKWQDAMGVLSEDDYLEKHNYVSVAVATEFVKATREPELEQIYRLVSEAIKEGTWKAIYATSDAEFDAIVEEMTNKAKELGYDECVAWDIEQGKLRTEAVKKALAGE